MLCEVIALWNSPRHGPRLALVGMLALGLAVALAVGVAWLAPGSARAAGTYDLTGIWNTYSDVGYTGTFQIASMNLATGAFSGTGDSGVFMLQGTETGSDVEFTQSEGSYVATDEATVESTSTGLEMVDGTFRDTNGNSGDFTADLATPPRTSSSSLNCSAGATPADPLDCTAIVSDTSGMTPAIAPTGTVALTSNDGQLSAPSCALTAAGASTASCSVTFTPPPNVGNGSAAPQITASYGGNTVFGASHDTATLSCASGLIFQVSGVTSTAPSTNGFRTGSPVVIHGCGLTAATVVKFGADTATAKVAQASDAAADGTALTLNVPVQAITGVLSVTDSSTGASETATLASPNPLQIDSWRNTEAFSFKNFPGTLTLQSFLAEFPTSNLTSSPGVLKPWADNLFMNAQKSIPAGVCYGIALTEGMLDDGSLSPASLGSTAQTPFAVPLSPGLTSWLDEKWLAQRSDQALPYYFEPHQRPPGIVGIEDDLNDLMPGGDGWSTPVIVGLHGHIAFADGWFGHAEVAYGWAATPQPGDPGEITIYTADSNNPFTAAEDADPTGGAHLTATTYSWVVVHSNGSWSASGEDPLTGAADGLELAPVSALQGTLTLSQKGATRQKFYSMLLDPADNVESIDGPSGNELSLADSSSPQLTIVPTISSAPPAVPAAGAATPTNGIGGISELLPSSAATTITLNAGSQPLGALWQGDGRDASLSAGAGHLRVGWNGSTGQIAVTPAPHETAPRSATLAVIAQLDGDRIERVLTVTGPPHLAASLGAGGGAALLHASSTGTFAVTLSITGDGVTPQTAILPPIRLRAGQSATLTPRNWSALATTSLAAIVGRARTTLHGLPRLPTAVVRALSVHGDVLHLSVRIPALVAGQSAVTLVALASRHGRVAARGVATATGAAAARTVTVTMALNHAPGTGARVRVSVVTLNGGTTPSRAVSSFTRG